MSDSHSDRYIERLEGTIKFLEKEIEGKIVELFSKEEWGQKLIDAIGSSILIVSKSGKIKRINKYTQLFFGWGDAYIEESIFKFLHFVDHSLHLCVSSKLDDCLNKELEANVLAENGETLSVGVLITKIQYNTYDFEYLYSIKDLTLLKVKQDQIVKLQSEIISNSYRDGVAENAVSVLHNVGNILSAMMGKVSNQKAMKNLNDSNVIMKKLNDTISPLKTEDDFKNYFLYDHKLSDFKKLIKLLLENYKSVEDEIYDGAEYIRNKCMEIGLIISNQQKFANFKKTDRENIDLNEIVSNCIYMYKEKLENHIISVVVDIARDCYCEIDKIGLVQTLNNLILNAIESIIEKSKNDSMFSQKQIRIHAKFSESSDSIILSIQDNGIGINKSLNLKNLTKMFNFGYSTKDRGSGFGLHNCKSFIESIGGQIKIESEGENLGAKITLVIPMK